MFLFATWCFSVWAHICLLRWRRVVAHQIPGPAPIWQGRPRRRNLSSTSARKKTKWRPADDGWRNGEQDRDRLGAIDCLLAWLIVFSLPCCFEMGQCFSFLLSYRCWALNHKAIRWKEAAVQLSVSEFLPCQHCSSLLLQRPYNWKHSIGEKSPQFHDQTSNDPLLLHIHTNSCLSANCRQCTLTASIVLP